MSRIYLSPPHMGNDELRFVKDAFDSGYVAPVGEQLERFEKEFCEKTGFPHAVAVSSGTAAMHLAMIILGIGPGDDMGSFDNGVAFGGEHADAAEGAAVFVERNAKRKQAQKEMILHHLPKNRKRNSIRK